MEILLGELRYLRRMCGRILVGFVLLFAMFLMVPLSSQTVAGFSVPLPATEGTTIAEQTIRLMRADLVPAGVELVSMTPIDAFYANAAISAMLAILILCPLALYEMWRFVSPGLYSHERRTLRLLVLLSAVLFVVGAVFAYVMLIPIIFSGLYAFTPVDAQALFSLRALVSLVAGMMLATAFLFLIPVVMVILSRAGVVPAPWWSDHAREAILITLVVSAIITPDGSGLSMVVLALPMCALYGGGYAGSMILTRKERSVQVA